MDKERDDTQQAEEASVAKHPTDDDDTNADKDSAVDEASEQSMDGSDAPAW